MRTLRNLPRMQLGWYGLIGWVLFSMMACAPAVQSTPSIPLTPVSVLSAPTTASASATLVPTRTAITTTTAITLTLWTTEDIAPSQSPSGRLLQNQFDLFSTTNPNIHINTILKKPYGKGGLLDFVLTTNVVVPNQLPDLIVLDIAEVPLAADAGVLQSFDGLLPAELTSDYFPFAVRAARYRNRWVAVPFAADTEHLAYSTYIVKNPPQTWDEFLRQREQMLVPLGGDDAFVAQYAALAPLDETLSLDSTSTTSVLNFFKRAHDVGLMSDATLGLKTVDEGWTLLTSRQAPMAQVAASRYLAEHNQFPDLQYAAIPTRAGKSTSVATGWAFAIITNDPVRQAAAAHLIQSLVDGKQLAPWLRATNRLPVTRAMLSSVIESPTYSYFLRTQLESAVYIPQTASYTKASDAWRIAIASVLKGQTTSEEAARAIVATK